MFFRLTTADSPPQPSRPVPSIHSSDNKSGITFAKICLRLKRHGSTESAEARDDDRRSQSSLPPLNGSPSPTLPTPPPSPQQARASSENITSPSSPRSPVISPSSSSRSSTSRSPKQKHHHAESSSGQIPLTHPGIAEHACPRREPIDRLDTYYCTGGVNVPVLLRTTRTDMIDIASILGANALVEEQWKCTIYGPRGRNKVMYKIQIHYKAQATRSTLPDPHQPVALDQTRSIPGLMTVVRRNED